MEFQAEKLLKNGFLEMLPFHVAVLDRTYNVIWANDKFKEHFGNLSGKTCYKICKNSQFPCAHCKVNDVFDKKETMVAFESATDSYGKTTNFAVYFVPLVEDDGKVNFVIEISTHLKDFGQWQKEYNLLFERVPCYITVIDRDFNIIRSNEKFRETFGESRGKTCFEAYKKKKTACINCPAVETFQTGEDCISTQIGVTLSGEKANYIVNTTPLAYDEKGVSLVMEIATDITEINKLQDQLKNAHDFYATIIQNSADGIIAIDNKGKIQIFNESAKKIFGWNDSRKPGIAAVHDFMPEEFFNTADDDGIVVTPSEKLVKDVNGDDIPVRFSAVQLQDKKRIMGKVGFMLDLRPLYEIEEEKRKSESNAKDNIMDGLDKALNLLSNLLSDDINFLEKSCDNSSPADIRKSIEFFKFKYEKTQIIKDAFLSYTRTHKIEKKKDVLNDILQKIFMEYFENVAEQKIKFTLDLCGDHVGLLCDAKAISSCLNIMILNSLNALVKRPDGRELTLKLQLDDNIAIIEVIHNACSNDIMASGLLKEKCFGLKTAEIIIKEHLGVIDIIAHDEVHCSFKIKLPLSY